MEFHLHDKVIVTKDVFFKNRLPKGILIKKGTIGIIIDICNSAFDQNKIGYTLELPDHGFLDPTFTFSEDCLKLFES